MQKLLKNSFILSIAEILLKIAKLIAFIVIANVYNVTYLGLFNYIVSFLLIFSIIGELGINTYITTEQSKLKNFPDKDILALGIFKLLNVLVMFLFATCIYLYIENENGLIFIFIMFSIFSDAILSMVYAFYRAINKYRYEFYFKTIQAFIYVFVSLLVYFNTKLEFAYFIGLLAFLNIFLALFSLYRLTNFIFYIKYIFIYLKENFLKHFKYIFPIFLSTVFTVMYFRIDILMLGSMIGIDSVGYYSIAYKLIEGAMVLPLMLGVVFLPKLSNNRKNIKYDLALHFVLGWIVFVLFYFSVSFVINVLFSDTYIYSIKIAKILSYSIVIMSINTYMFSYFIATKNAYVNAKVTFFMFICNLLLNYIYIPYYGIYAAAYTTVATELIGMLNLFYYMKRYYVSRQL